MNKTYINKIGLLIIVSLMIINISGCSSRSKEGLVAEVNGMVITQDEFNGDYQMFRSIYERQLGQDVLQQVGQDGNTIEESLKIDIIEKLVMEKLVEKETQDMNITVTDDDIRDRINEYTVRMGGQEKFDEFFETNDISKEFFFENIRKEILVDKHREHIINNVNISDDESKEFFEKYKDDLVLVRISHIMVSNQEDGNRILERLRNGEDFATIATLESQHSVSAVRGGDLGYISKGQLESDSEEVAFSLDVGEISDLIKTEVGYRIIRVEDKKNTFEDLKDQVMDILKEQEYFESIQDLRTKAKVINYIDLNNINK